MPNLSPMWQWSLKEVTPLQQAQKTKNIRILLVINFNFALAKAEVSTSSFI